MVRKLLKEQFERIISRLPTEGNLPSKEDNSKVLSIHCYSYTDGRISYCFKKYPADLVARIFDGKIPCKHVQAKSHDSRYSLTCYYTFGI